MTSLTEDTTTNFADHPRAEEFTEFIEELADAAGGFLAERHDGSRFETKDDASPVTEFDRGVEQKLRDIISARYPEHGIIGEEFPPEREDAEFVWIMDPIDGTKQFVTGVPTFTTLIALCHYGKPVVGVINAHAARLRWLGVEGRPTTLNGTEVRTSGRTELDGAVMGWSDPEAVILKDHGAGRDALIDRTAIRIYGIASFAFGRLAAGSIDVCVYSGGIGTYDICAFVPIIEGAGGAVTDGYGEPITTRDIHSCVAAASPELHREVVETLNRK